MARKSVSKIENEVTAQLLRDVDRATAKVQKAQQRIAGKTPAVLKRAMFFNNIVRGGKRR